MDFMNINVLSVLMTKLIIKNNRNKLFHFKFLKKRII